jgi:hypothetical protein
MNANNSMNEGDGPENLELSMLPRVISAPPTDSGVKKRPNTAERELANVRSSRIMSDLPDNPCSIAPNIKPVGTGPIPASHQFGDWPPNKRQKLTLDTTERVDGKIGRLVGDEEEVYLINSDITIRDGVLAAM